MTSAHFDDFAPEPVPAPGPTPEEIVDGIDLVVDDAADTYDAEAVRRAVTEESYGVRPWPLPVPDDW